MFVTIKADRLTKRFNKLTLFKDLEFSVSTAGSLAITGDNGSGKSTLLEIISGIQKPTSGELLYFKDSNETDLADILPGTGFASLKINPYVELTAFENIQFAYRYNTNEYKKNNFEENAKYLLDKFSLYSERNKRVKFFSSGMKQRLRIIFAIMHDPHIIILDEPGTNLDTSGQDALYSYLDTVKEKKVIIIATNYKREADFCDNRIFLKK
jgi:heme exporter protein A